MPKNILITAGPTWVALDGVRVISNIATAQTGFLLAKEAKKRGYQATLALGPAQQPFVCRNIIIKPFRYFDELLHLIKKEAGSKKYDIIIHTAAVSDYQPAGTTRKKIKSGIKNLILRLKPTLKIVNYIKKLDRKIFLVMFKLETEISDEILINRAKDALIKAKADLIVANKTEPRYKAFIMDGNRIYARLNSKREMSEKLFDVIARKRAG